MKARVESDAMNGGMKRREEAAAEQREVVSSMGSPEFEVHFQ